MFKGNYFYKKFHHRCLAPLYRIPVNKKNIPIPQDGQWNKVFIKALNFAHVSLLWKLDMFQKLFLFIILPFDMLCILFRPANPSRNYMYQIGKKQLFIKVLNLFKVNKKDIWTTSTEVSLISVALTLNTFSIVVF